MGRVFGIFPKIYGLHLTVSELRKKSEVIEQKAVANGEEFDDEPEDAVFFVGKKGSVFVFQFDEEELEVPREGVDLVDRGEKEHVEEEGVDLVVGFANECDGVFECVDDANKALDGFDG